MGCAASVLAPRHTAAQRQRRHTGSVVAVGSAKACRKDESADESDADAPQRRILLNGFACDATPPSCRRHPGGTGKVAFPYRREPPAVFYTRGTGKPDDECAIRRRARRLSAPDRMSTEGDGSASGAALAHELAWDEARLRWRQRRRALQVEKGAGTRVGVLR